MIKKHPLPPGKNQESVWDYPRPPRLEDSSRHIKIVVAGKTVADSIRTKRVLETSHPPVYYIPPDDVDMSLLRSAVGRTWCEWKGEASYYDIVVGDRTIHQAAWAYASPTRRFAGIQDYLAWYPSKMDLCTVDGEVVQAQEGDFYGGWITSEIVGPFKGAPGTMDW